MIRDVQFYEQTHNAECAYSCYYFSLHFTSLNYINFLVLGGFFLFPTDFLSKTMLIEEKVNTENIKSCTSKNSLQN